MENNNINQNTSAEKKLKTIIGVLAALCVVLGVLLITQLTKKTEFKENVIELTNDKEVLMNNVAQLQQDYATLSSTNDTINTQLSIEREKVANLIEKIKKTEASNKNQLHKYEQELSSLRSTMQGYIKQIEELNQLNTALKEENEQVKKEVEETTTKYEELKTTAEELTKQVDKGSVIKGRNLSVVALNSNEKETNRSSRTRKLKSCFYLIENSIAKTGPMSVYIRVLGPDGILLTDGSQQMFVSNGEQLIYSATREVDYQGEELQVCVYFSPNSDFTKGVYTVEAYTEKGLIGTTDMFLK